MARYQKPIFSVYCYRDAAPQHMLPGELVLKSEWLGKAEAAKLAMIIWRMMNESLYNKVVVVNEAREVILTAPFMPGHVK